MSLTTSQVIVLATPVFLLLIALELAWGWRRRRNTYRLADAITSIGLGMMSQATMVLTRLLRVGIYAAVFASVALWRNDAFWTSPAGWLLALVFYDFCYYWLHRAGHEVAVLWAAHVVHHQSEDYNLSTALRQTSSGVLLGWIFYLPMALAGVPPAVFAVVALVDLLYQFWVHTEHVPRLGWFDRWFCSPSNHRVHHAVNDRYLDRNYGGILVVWDRLFGSFQEEDEPCVYGTRSPLRSWDPLWSNLEVYAALARDSWRARSWRDKLRVWIKPPGWQPPDVAARWPRAPFRLEAAARYHPPMTRGIAVFALAQFLALLGGVGFFLWHADGLHLLSSIAWLVALCGSLWAVGAVMQGRITVLEVLVVEAGALAMATSATGHNDLYQFFKPLAMVLVIAFVLRRGLVDGMFAGLLVAGLAFSMLGDVLLLLPGRFIPGLASFLVAHLFYIALFRRGVPWFPSKRALAACMLVSASMVAVLWDRLGPMLQVAVSLYGVVIALMAGQAIGRALVLRDRAATGVAVGAVFFMASDSLLAINRFATPLPLASLWVLGTYYVAQLLIARNAQPVVKPPVAEGVEAPDGGAGASQPRG